MFNFNCLVRHVALSKKHPSKVGASGKYFRRLKFIDSGVCSKCCIHWLIVTKNEDTKLLIFSEGTVNPLEYNNTYMYNAATAHYEYQAWNFFQWHSTSSRKAHQLMKIKFSSYQLLYLLFIYFLIDSPQNGFNRTQKINKNKYTQTPLRDKLQ